MPTIALSDGGSIRITDDRMMELASYVKRLIEQGETERKQYSDFHGQSRNDYENQPYPYISKIVTGATDLPFPFAFTRAEALSDHVITSIVTQSPMATCLEWPDEEPQMPAMPPVMGVEEPEDDSSAEDRERTMDEVLRRAKIEERLKTIGPACWYANCGILRASKGTADDHIRLDSICPEDFVVVGSGAYGIKDSLMVGHRFQRTRGDIKRMQLIGRYADSIDADQLTSSQSNGATTSGAGATDAELVDLWQVYPYLDPQKWDSLGDQPEVTNKERRFSVVIEPESEAILVIEEYTLQTPCYFAFGYKPAPPRGFWHPRPLGSDMQGPHRAYQCLSNLALYGTAMSCMPPMVAQKGAFARDQSYGPGQYVNMESGDLQSPVINFNLQYLQAELQRIERVGDGVARINAAGAGQESQQNKTATQSNNEAAGMQAGLGGFLETFSGPLTDLCEHIEEILAATFDEWKPVFKGQMPVKDPSVFEQKAKWDVPGKIPNLNPQAIVANLQVLMGIVGQVFQMAASGGPVVLEWGVSLLKVAMNAMDFPDAEGMMEPLEAMIEQGKQQQQQPEPEFQTDPGLGGEPNPDELMAALLQGVGGAGVGEAEAMPDAIPY